MLSSVTAIVDTKTNSIGFDSIELSKLKKSIDILGERLLASEQHLFYCVSPVLRACEVFLGIDAYPQLT